ncbi:MAG: DUF4296 domain-containing protein [Bacteroidia bacterium]
MIRLSKITILLSIFIIGCSEDPPISKEKMVPIMADAMRMEAAEQIGNNYITIPDSIWKLNYTFLMQKYSLDSTTFNSAMRYYTERPAEFSKIMEQVIEILQKEELKEFKR